VPKAGVGYTAGADLAKHADYTVVTVMDDGGHVVAFDRYGELNWPFQRKRIVELVQRYSARLLVDSTGVGDVIYDDLRREQVSVEGYKLTHASKAELIENLSIMIEQGKIHFPKIPELVAELKMYGWTKSKGGNIIYNAPEGYHDDCVISLALAAWQNRNPTGFWV